MRPRVYKENLFVTKRPRDFHENLFVTKRPGVCKENLFVTMRPRENLLVEGGGRISSSPRDQEFTKRISSSPRDDHEFTKRISLSPRDHESHCGFSDKNVPISYGGQRLRPGFIAHHVMIVIGYSQSYINSFVKYLDILFCTISIYKKKHPFSLIIHVLFSACLQ